MDAGDDTTEDGGRKKRKAYHPRPTEAQLQNFRDQNLFREVDEKQMETVGALFENSCIVRIAYEAAVAHLLGGEILFQRGDGAILDTNAQQSLIRGWMTWVRALVRSLYTYGFAAAIIEEHDTYVGIPRLIDLTRVRVRIHEDIFGCRTYYYFEKTPPMSMLGTGGSPLVGLGNEIPIEGVQTFEMEPPNSEGNLRSRLTSLMPDIMYYSALSSYYLDAVKRMSNPPLVAQQIEGRHDDSELTYGMTPHESVHEAPNPNRPHVRAGAREVQRLQEDIARRAAGASDGSGTGFSGGDPTNLVLNIGDVSVIPLPPKHQLVRQLPSIPPPALLEFHLQLQTEICALFGVPVSLFSPAGKGSKASSSYEENMMYYKEGQRKMVALVRPMVERMYNTIYMSVNRQEILAYKLSRNEELFDEQELDDMARVRVLMPGVLGTEMAFFLYEKGVMSFAGLKHCLTVSEGVPEQFMNKEPSVTVQELNGVTEEPLTNTVTETKEQKKQSATGAASGNKVTTTKVTPLEKSERSRPEMKPMNMVSGMKRKDASKNS